MKTFQSKKIVQQNQAIFRRFLQNAGTVAEIAYQVGFDSEAHFATMFQKQFGCTPSEYRKAQKA